MVKRYFLIAAIVAIGTIEVAAQEYDRSVTIETQFQPVIQDAGKINLKPVVQSTTIAPVKETYSELTKEVHPGFTPAALLSEPVDYPQPDSLHGLLQGGVGHINSAFKFAYTIADKKKNSLTIAANHEGAWGTKTLENTDLKIGFSHGFYNGGKFYMDLWGKNQFFTRYGVYYDMTANDLTVKRYAQMADSVRQSVWWGGAQFGFQSNPREDLTYDVRLGYDLVNMPTLANEHHVKANLNLQWTSNEHRVGGKVLLQGNFYQMEPAFDSLRHNNRYNIRVEPFYEYTIDRFFLHVGVNVDLNYGKGQQFSNVDKLAFAPSPNVRFEAQLAPKWVILYGEAKGSFALGNSDEFIQGNRYRDFACSVTSLHTSGYTPIEGQLGFRFRPEKNLIFDVFGGYGMRWNTTASIFVPQRRCLDYVYMKYNCGVIGVSFSYHYQDIITIHGWGDYHFSDQLQLDQTSSLYDLNTTELEKMPVYDRPLWKAGLDIDARIDNHWSLYSHNQFKGKQFSIAYIDNQWENKQSAPWIEINLGCQYEFDNRLALYLDLNNLINRKNDIYYGYQTMGINFLVGAKWRF